jgi:hypothetical protein
MMSETSKMIPSNIPIAFSLQAVDEARSALARSPAWVALPTSREEATAHIPIGQQQQRRVKTESAR